MDFETASKNPAAALMNRIWDLFVSPTAFVILSILWCLDLAVGSLLAYRNDPRFWMKMDSVPFNYWLKVMAPQEYPTSIWVYILVVLTYLMVLSLLLCTVNWFLKKRRRYRGMAEVLVHFGFLLVFAGYVLGSGWGARVQDIALSPGGETEIQQLGLRLKVDSTEVKTDQSGNELDTVSAVTLTDLGGNVIKSGTVSINHPLIAGSTVVYPNGNVEDGAVSVEVEGQGRFSLSGDGKTEMPDGRKIGIRGFLGEGQRWGKWIGPGVFLTIADKEGSGVFTGFLGFAPELRSARFGSSRLSLLSIGSSKSAAFWVHRDPGIQLVLIGALILTLGTFWALWGYLTRSGYGD